MDFAEFAVGFADEPGVVRKVWLFTMILGHSRWLWGRYVASQNLQSVMRCHIAAFEAIGGVPEEILYDRMKTAVIGEDEVGVVSYNASLVALLNHYGVVPRACRPYRAKTKGKIERPYRYIRQDFFLARAFRNLDDLNAQFDTWRTEVANPRVHATTRRVVEDAFAEELPHLKPSPAIPYEAVLTIERRGTGSVMPFFLGEHDQLEPPLRQLRWLTDDLVRASFWLQLTTLLFALALMLRGLPARALDAAQIADLVRVNKIEWED